MRQIFRAWPSEEVPKLARTTGFLPAIAGYTGGKILGTGTSTRVNPEVSHLTNDVPDSQRP
jgi:hypothetical protein